MRLQNPTSISMTGTSIRTPTTVASAAPEDRPNSMTDVALLEHALREDLRILGHYFDLIGLRGEFEKLSKRIGIPST